MADTTTDRSRLRAIAAEFIADPDRDEDFSSAMTQVHRAVSDEEFANAIRILRRNVLWISDDREWIFRAYPSGYYDSRYCYRKAGGIMECTYPITVMRDGEEHKMAVGAFIRKYRDAHFTFSRVNCVPAAPGEDVSSLTPPDVINISPQFPQIDTVVNMELVAPVIELFRIHWACGREDRLDYILNWFAEIVQHPRGARRTALVITGKPGSGKSLLMDTISKQFADLALKDSPDILHQRYNRRIEGKLLVCMDGVDTGSIGRRMTDKLRNWITAETLLTREKWRPDHDLDFHARFVIISFNGIPLKIEPRDRNFIVLRTNDWNADNHEYWAPRANYLMRPDVRRALLAYLAHKDISRWRVSDEFPE